MGLKLYLILVTGFLTLLISCTKSTDNKGVGESESSSASATSSLKPVTDKGVIFYANNVDQAFNLAMSEQKPVFIEIYSETCHVCQSFLPVFDQPEVSKFHNANFLNYRIEVSSPEFQSFVISERILVPSLPIFLYYDAQRNLQHLAMIDPLADKLIEQGKIALDPSLRGSGMSKRFLNGERDKQFLIDYAMYSKVTMDTLANRASMEAYAKLQPISTYTDETNYRATQKLVMDVENPMGKYFIEHLPAYRKLYDPAEVKQVAENLVMSSLYSSFGATYSSDKIKLMRDYMIRAEIDPQVARNRILLPLINAYFREKATSKATALVNTHTTQVPLKVTDYLYLIRHFNEHSPDASYVPSAEKWVENAMNLVPKGGNEEIELRSELAAAKRRLNP